MIRAEDRMWSGLVNLFGPFRLYVIVVALLLVGYFVRSTIEAPHNWGAYLLVGLILATSSVGLMWCARWAWRLEGYVTLRAILAGVIGYHALFGLVMLWTRMRYPVTSNDDFVMQCWPHVVHFINSFE